MRKSHIGIAFLVGSAAVVLGQAVIAPRSAVAQATPRKWEQFCTFRKAKTTNLPDAMNPDLKEKGIQGWEIVTMTNSFQEGEAFTYYCFKRPVP
jgi:hypothetical protein